MPSISTTNINETSFRGVISGLAFPANYYDYFEIELWNSTATTFYYAHNWIDSSTVNKYSYIDFSGLAEGTTYTIKGFVKSSGGSRTHVGTIPVTTDSPPGPVRPLNWEWASLVGSRATDPSVTYTTNIPLALVNASEWNSFTSQINLFRAYKGLSSYSFTQATSGAPFTDTMYDQAVNALSSMASVITSGGYYTKLMNLKNALNSIS